MVVIYNFFFFLVSTLLTKLKRSRVGIDSTKPAYEELTNSCQLRKLPVEDWRKAEALAMEERGENLGIFDITHKKLPSLAEITLKLTDAQVDYSNGINVVDWIADGIKVENDQWVLNFIFLIYSYANNSRSRLRWEISKLPEKPTVKQQLKISRMRSRLGKQVKDFLGAVSMFLPAIEEDDLREFKDELIDTPSEEAVEPEDLMDGNFEDEFYFEEEDEAEPASDLPESIVLPLPSNIISDNLRPSLKSLISIEMELRKGQANDALEGIRIGLANKSLLLQTDVNKSTSTKQSTRAWTSVRNAQSQILQHARAYQRAWQAIKSNGARDDLDVYQKLEEKDLVVVKDITMAKRFGQGSDRLAWFWRIGPSKDELTGEWMQECE